MIRSIGELPLVPSEVDTVYSASTRGERAWIWDLALDGDGNPVIVYASFPSTAEHVYRYARWDGTGWKDQRITASGGSIDDSGADPYYSGGIVLDHENTAKVYLCRQVEGTQELEAWTTSDGGISWRSQSITSHSSVENARPVVPRDHGSEVEVVWLRGQYFSYTKYQTAVAFSGADSSEVVARLRAVAGRGHVEVQWTYRGSDSGTFEVLRAEAIDSVYVPVSDVIATVAGQAVYTYWDRNVAPATEYFYLLAYRETDQDPWEHVGPAGVETPALGCAIRMVQPNPSAGPVSIHYELSEPGLGRIEILTAAGRRVRSVLDQRQQAGYGTFAWDGRDRDGRMVPAGVYFLRLELPCAVQSYKLVLVR